MIFADKEFYKKEYLLGRKEVIPFSEFEFWARNASMEIDKSTSKQIELEEVIRIISENDEQTEIVISIAVLEEVKMCTCELAELFYIENQKVVKTKQSERVGDYSVSYAEQDVEKLNSNKESILFKWLLNIGLLYRGRN